jgi:hypothetical protein
MKVGDIIRRSTPWDEIQKTIHDIDDLRLQEKMHREGKADFEVLVNGKWETVPKLVIHQKPIDEGCTSCHA